MSEEEPKELWDKVGIVIEDPAGTLWENQTGGYACHHPEIRGVLVEFPEKISNFVQSFMDGHFAASTGKWGGSCWTGDPKSLFTKDDAYICDLLLASIADIFEIEGFSMAAWSVDCDRLKDCEEAWVLIKSPNGSRGVLFWNNSD